MSERERKRNEGKERTGGVGWDELGMEGKRRGERRRYGRKKKDRGEIEERQGE